MIEIIGEAHHPEMVRQFKDAARGILPILCFTPAQIEDFIQEFTPESDGRSGLERDDQGRLTFFRLDAHSPEAKYIEYVLPSVWEDRYGMVESAVEQIRDSFLADGTEHELRMDIDERPPSHASYFAGLLPRLGFRLQPRVTMTADQELVQGLAVPELPEGVHEMAYHTGLKKAAIDVYLRAHELNEQAPTADERIRAREADARYMADIFPLERSAQTWVGLGDKGRLIGFAMGGVWGDEISLEEVALLPEFHGQGLGRRLTIRCLQGMDALYDGAGKYFAIGADRTNVLAMKLYHRLGFVVDKVQSYAILVNPGMNRA